MMKHLKKALLIITFFYCHQQTFAQADTLPEKISWFGKNFFMNGGFTIFWDSWHAPDRRYDYLVLVSGTVEPRFNVWNLKDKASFSVNFPVSLGLGVGDPGFGDIELPLLLTFNRGYHSTFNNIDHLGVSIGAGIQRSIYPLSVIEDQYYKKTSWFNYVASITFKTDQRKFLNTFGLITGFNNGFSFKVTFGTIFFYN